MQLLQLGAAYGTPAACLLERQALPNPPLHCTLSPPPHPHPPQQVAFFFPGQGAQTVGMGVEVAGAVPAAKALFDRASDILGYDLLALCAEGAPGGGLP